MKKIIFWPLLIFLLCFNFWMFQAITEVFQEKDMIKLLVMSFLCALMSFCSIYPLTKNKEFSLFALSSMVIIYYLYAFIISLLNDHWVNIYEFSLLLLSYTIINIIFYKKYKNESMRTKNKLAILLGLLIVVSGAYLIYNGYKNDVETRCTTYNSKDPNLSDMFVCMEAGHIYKQEQYDAYYNIVTKNISDSILKDSVFFLGFTTAYNNCSLSPSSDSCNMHNKEVYNQFIEKCTMNAQTNLYCTEAYFYNKTPNKENIRYFIKIVKSEIASKGNNTYWTCEKEYKSFYSKINKELMNELPKNIRDICERK